MANRTVKDAKSVRGTNPQFLVEKIIRSRIYECKYWKEECFALSAELIVDKAMELRFIGGVYGGSIKPTPFLCLTLKMLQIQPEKDIIVEFIKNEEFKYVRALGALYMRLVGTALECFKYLEPLLNDSRKLRRQNRQGAYELVHMDEFIDELLREERICDVILPRIQKRYVLEEANEIEARISALEDDVDDGMETSGDEDEPVPNKPEQVHEKTRPSREERGVNKQRSKPKEHDRKHGRERERERERKGHRERSRSRERRHRSRSPLQQSRGDRGDRRDKTRRDHDRHDRDRDRNRDRDRDRDRNKNNYG
ncbi:hypothetical protein AAG570_009499 [Ranatra chinensis]|uniref:Pre-mRNA-splicing factor 38 n=1 Tax=Ranatra chinensis TaxID=642074 RepID=A0ABD0Z6C1_9HEMI